MKKDMSKRVKEFEVVDIITDIHDRNIPGFCYRGTVEGCDAMLVDTAAFVELFRFAMRDEGFIEAMHEDEENEE